MFILTGLRSTSLVRTRQQRGVEEVGGIEEVFCLIYLHCRKMTAMVCCVVLLCAGLGSQFKIDIFILG